MATRLASAPAFEEDARVLTARREAEALGRSDLPILIVGEAGTGRTTLASVIADARARRSSSSLLELPVGADFEPPGDGAVVLLRHVELTPASTQARFADALRRRQLHSAVMTGSLEQSPLHPELAALVASTTIVLPPLRERGDDAVAWAELFAQGDDAQRRLSDEARRAIRLASWTGNLTELRSSIERALLLTDSSELGPEDLGLDGQEPPSEIIPLSEAVDDFKRRYVRKVVDRLGGNRTQAARALGVDPRTVFRMLQSTSSD